MACHLTAQEEIHNEVVRKRKIRKLADIIEFEKERVLKSCETMNQSVSDDSIRIFGMCQSILNGNSVDTEDLKWLESINDEIKCRENYVKGFFETLPESLQHNFLSYIPTADDLRMMKRNDNSVAWGEKVKILWMAMIGSNQTKVRYCIKDTPGELLEDEKKEIITRLTKFSVAESCQVIDMDAIVSLKTNVFPPQLRPVIGVINQIFDRVTMAKESPLTFYIICDPAIYYDFLEPFGYIATYDTTSNILTMTV